MGKISAAPRSSRQFFEQDSMESFVKTVNTDSSLSGSYPTQSLTAKGSVSVLTGYSVHDTSHFHSTQLDVTVVTRAVDLLQTSACLGSESNYNSDYLSRLAALPLISDPEETSQWAPYVNFLEDQGSHMMIQQSIGSRFQQWESSESSSSSTANTLKVKACASVEGVGGKTGWSVEGCAAYSNSQKQSALATSTQSLRLILGGSTDARLALTEEMSEENLQAFIASAEQGTHAVAYAFKPVWEMLITFYTGRCAATGGTVDCENEQRAYNLQAAYEGWLGVQCPKLHTRNGVVYQQMVFSSSSGHSRTYQCNAAKTGCHSNDDCHLGGAGSVCYCYGESCLDTGDAVEGSSKRRSKVRGSKSGSYHSGVNNACYYHFIAHCDCDHGWSGGLPDRTLYVQGGADLSYNNGDVELVL